MEIQFGDILTMKKAHPCGGKQWLVLQAGAELRLRCLTCGHELSLARQKAEKSVRGIRHALTAAPQE